MSRCANWGTDCPDTCLGCLMYREPDEYESSRDVEEYWEDRYGHD